MARRLHSVVAILFPTVINMGSVTLFLFQKLVGVIASVIFTVSKLLLPLFSFITSFSFRLHGNGGSLSKNFDSPEVISEEINPKDLKPLNSQPELEPEPKPDSGDVGSKESSGPELETKANIDKVEFTESEDDCEGKEKLEFSFTFRFPTFEEFSKSKKEDNRLYNSDSVSSTSSSKYDDFIPSTSHSYVFNVEAADTSGKNLEELVPETTEIFYEQSKDKSGNDGEESERNEAINLMRETEEHNFLNFNDFCNSEKDSIFTTDSEAAGTTNFGRVLSVTTRSTDSCSDGFLSDDDFGDEGDVGIADVQLRNPDANAIGSQFLSEEDFRENSNEIVDGEFDEKDDKEMNGSYDSEKLRSKDTCELDQDSNKLETLWEHQDLIEQLKMELRKVRATGLPTILEESESPKITDDLKPWKIDEKFQHEDCMDELHKFYKTYSERMRKFDIFNYQKMYAIGFLQLKDPFQPISSPKTSGPTLKSLLSQNFRQLKHKSSENEPMIEFMKDLQSDLEVVYVGQMCLSWEFLHWQYGKALDLWDSDPRGIHRYNEVAGEFQQFQVLMQRFTEDEHFQGPRVQYYVKRRCVLRNLLQVPLIREDNFKDKRKGKRGERAEYVITSDMLVEIIEESIRIFWRFVRADRNCSTAIAKGHKGTLAQLQNPVDLEFLMDIKKDLQKKERKLKDLVRSENCILRRFGKCREDDSDHVLYFFSQVDMKLVSRVLNMGKITTDQLLWCHSKLSRISFENRKIQVEPSFLLFPC